MRLGDVPMSQNVVDLRQVSNVAAKGDMLSTTVDTGAVFTTLLGAFSVVFLYTLLVVCAVALFQKWREM